MSDKISSRWPVQHYPSPIYGHTAVAVELPTTAFINFTGSPDLQSRKVMLLNGGWPWNSSSQPNVSLVLDTNTWTWWNVYVPLEFPKNRHYHTFVSSSTGDFAIMFGGYQSMKYLNDLYILSTNPTTFGWYRIETPCCAPKGRYGHASVLVESDDSKFKLFLFGGVTEGNVPLADMYVLEFTPLETSPPNWNFTWTQVNFTGASPEPRFFHSLNHQNSDILYL